MVKETIERYSIRAAGHADNYSCDACVQYLTENGTNGFPVLHAAGSPVDKTDNGDRAG